jgi:hypothetical protein
MAEFERQSYFMYAREEVTDDVLDAADQRESETMVSQVLDKIGISIKRAIEEKSDQLDLALAERLRHLQG